METRKHILLECPYWIRPTDWPEFENLPIEVQEQMWTRLKNILIKDLGVTSDDPEMDAFLQTNNLTWQHVRDFLQWNPIVGTFEWGDIETQYMEAREKRDHEGSESWLTPEYVLFKLITDERKEAFKKWLKVRKGHKDRTDKGHIKLPNAIAFNKWFRKKYHAETVIANVMAGFYKDSREPWPKMKPFTEYIIGMSNLGMNAYNEKVIAKKKMWNYANLREIYKETVLALFK